MITCNMIKLPVLSNFSGSAVPFVADQLCALQKANCTVTNKSFIDKHYQVVIVVVVVISSMIYKQNLILFN